MIIGRGRRRSADLPVYLTGNLNLNDTGNRSTPDIPTSVQGPLLSGNKYIKRNY